MRTKVVRADPESPGGMEEADLDNDEAPAKRRPWGPDEDEHLRQLVHIYGIKSWAKIATQLNNRNGKQCRERWRNHLRPELNKGDWSNQEDIDIWERVQEMGTKWAQISEMYMPQRTDNDIKNRWNSIIRKTQHPAGRDWLPDENEARAAILGTASRTQVRRAGGGGEKGERKRQRVTGTGHRKPSAGFSDTLAPTATSHADDEADDESPNPSGRKLFESPEAVAFNEALAEAEDDDTLGPDRMRGAEDDESDGEEDGVGLEAADEAEACRMLVGGEIAADTFDVEAFLPVAAAAMGSLSQMSSPVGDGKARPASRAQAQDWFDPELDSSLSPILTPSLRHQLRAWMASRSDRSPTPRAASKSTTPSSRAHLLGLGAALTAAASTSITSVTSAVSTTLSTALGGAGALTPTGAAASSSATPRETEPRPVAV